jgi:alanyl-tRNA synthetase
VLRRLLRRAVRYGRVLGIQRPFLYRLTGVVAEIMRDYYPEPEEKKEFIERVIRGEEERFLETLSEGLNILEEVAERARKEGRSAITGEEAFRLYDTYGFPIDLTEDFAREKGLTVDREGFERAMEDQRERARAARKDVDSMQVQGGVLSDLNVESRFVGYTERTVSTRVAAIIRDDQLSEEAGEGQTCTLILEETPFYAESGGQVADKGWIVSPQARLRVEDVQKGPRGEHLHTVRVEEGTLRLGERVEATIDAARDDIRKNHTATHLLHKALKEVLGDHVNQAGSLVAPDRLRFDFTHIGPMSEEEIREVEDRVNRQVWADTEVEVLIKPLEEAKRMGAMALFGEKYGDIVRVIRIGDYSLELCGGTHVNRTSEIGMFKIVSEGGIGSGTRRIEAVTGRYAFRYLDHHLGLLKKAASLLKASPADVTDRVETLQARIKELTRENESLRDKLNHLEAVQLAEQVEETAGVPVLTAKVEASGMDDLRRMVDDVKSRVKEGVIVLGAVAGGKVQLVASVSPRFVEAGLHAGRLVKEVATRCGGGGGGRPDLAQAGGKQPEKLDEALRAVPDWIRQHVQ